MPTEQMLRSSVARLRQELGRALPAEAPLLEAVRKDPASILSGAKIAPDPWQAELLRARWSRALLLCSRQVGKSTAAAGLALHAALTRPGSLTLLLSPTLRQSGELFRDKVLRLWRALGSPLAGRPPTQLEVALANGSRVVSLPGEESNTRGFSGVGLLVIDEAARVPDDLYRAVRPMLAVSGGRLVCLSTAFAKMGWFYEAFTGSDPWRRVRVRARECARISAEFLEEERKALGRRWFAMEYDAEFQDAVASLFSGEDIRAALSAEVTPLFGGEGP